MKPKDCEIMRKNYVKPEIVNYLTSSSNFIAASKEVIIIPDKDTYNFPCQSADWSNKHHCSTNEDFKFTECNKVIDGITYYGALKNPYTFTVDGKTITIPANQCMEIIMDGEKVTVRL